MSRIRAILLSMGLVIVVLLAQSVSQAQAPGGRGGDRGGDRGGRGGPGGFGGRTRVSSPLTLAMNKYVQEDLKLTETQKEQVKALSDKTDAERRERFSRGRGDGNNPAGKGAEGQPNPAAAKADGPATNGRGGATRGGPGDTPAGKANNGGDRGRRGGGNEANGGPGGRPGFGFGNGGGGFDRDAMRAEMERRTAETEAALAKILTKPQIERILQIQLQQEGPMAVTKPSMQKKLNMSQTQMAQIAMILDNREQAQAELRNAGGQMFAAFRTADGGFDRDAMRAKMQDPQFKSQMEKMGRDSRDQREQLEDQTIAMIGKTMTKKQHQNFQKLKGAPFDLEKLDRNYNPEAAAAKAKAEAEAEKEAAGSKKGSSSKKKSLTKSRRSN